MGGGWRQAGLLAAAGIYALDYQVERLKDDHSRAKQIGWACESLAWVAEVMPVSTNIVIIKLQDEIKASAKVAELDSKGIKCAPFGPQYIRFVTHLNFDDEALLKFIQFINQ